LSRRVAERHLHALNAGRKRAIGIHSRFSLRDDIGAGLSNLCRYLRYSLGDRLVSGGSGKLLFDDLRFSIANFSADHSEVLSKRLVLCCPDGAFFRDPCLGCGEQRVTGVKPGRDRGELLRCRLFVTNADTPFFDDRSEGAPCRRSQLLPVDLACSALPYLLRYAIP